jgi:hypothetical protein
VERHPHEKHSKKVSLQKPSGKYRNKIAIKGEQICAILTGECPWPVDHSKQMEA